MVPVQVTVATSRYIIAIEKSVESLCDDNRKVSFVRLTRVRKCYEINRYVQRITITSGIVVF